MAPGVKNGEKGPFSGLQPEVTYLGGNWAVWGSHALHVVSPGGGAIEHALVNP